VVAGGLSATGVAAGPGLVTAPGGPAGLLTSNAPAGLLGTGEAVSSATATTTTALSTQVGGRALQAVASPFGQFGVGVLQGAAARPDSPAPLASSRPQALGQQVGRVGKAIWDILRIVGN